MRKKRRTTIYLPDDLKQGIERAAGLNGVTEAQIIRDAVSHVLAEKPVYPEPRIPLDAFTLGAPDVAERAEELLDRFGR